MKGIPSSDADGRSRARDPRVHDGEDCARDRGEVVGGEGGDNPFPQPPDASKSSNGGRGVKGNIKRVEEGSL